MPITFICTLPVVYFTFFAPVLTILYRKFSVLQLGQEMVPYPAALMTGNGSVSAMDTGQTGYGFVFKGRDGSVLLM